MSVADVVFELRGQRVPRDHGYSLFRALSGRLDWLEDEPEAGVHPIYGTVSDIGEIFLGRRAKLILRLPAHRVPQAAVLEGALLDVGTGLEVGAGHLRELAPYATQYSHFVSTGPADEAEFLSRATALLREAGLACTMICGKPHRAAIPEGEVHGFSLLLHGLTPEQSLAMQETGLGQGRKLGCGIFVPHKSLAAVAA